MKDPEEVLVDSNRTWEEEKERVKEHKRTKKEMLFSQNKASRTFYVLSISELVRLTA